MSGGGYLAAAYVVVLATILVYVLIIGLKVTRLQRDLAELAARRKAPRERDPEREATPVG